MSAELMPGVFLSTHPLIAHKMTLLRDRKTASHDFRRLLREITFYLGFEATRDLKLQSHAISTPLGEPFDGVKLSESISIIPILRAGLGMADGILDLIPRASVHHIGMYRNKTSLLPVQYYNKLPKDHPCDVAFICDPCIATANTLSACVNIVKTWGAKRIIVVAAIASRSGVESLMSKHPDITVFVSGMDEQLTMMGMITPGLGDAGDRQFGTPFDELPTAAEDGGDRKRSRSDSHGAL